MNPLEGEMTGTNVTGKHMVQVLPFWVSVFVCI